MFVQISLTSYVFEYPANVLGFTCIIGNRQIKILYAVYFGEHFSDLSSLCRVKQVRQEQGEHLVLKVQR